MPSQKTPRNKGRRGKSEKSYYWVTTRLLRESGPWYAQYVKSPEDVQNVMRQHLDLENADREYFVALYLDKKCSINAANIISVGGLSNTIVHPREVFKIAILTSSNSIIVCHNHPSGDPSPSKEDIEVTKRLVKAGKILGIELLDHVIIGNKDFASFQSLGLMQKK